ncbi:hypothetical protein ACJMK2_003247, partial [Sinanodonta woodiana]
LLCPITINNGNVNEAECNRRIYSECPYTCKQGFDPNPKQTKVKCHVNGTWSNDEEPYCLEHDRGLILTARTGYSTKHIYTVPTTLEGTPKLDYIRLLSLETEPFILSSDGDYMLKQVYFYDANSKAIYKDANFSIGLSGENIWTPVHMGTSDDYVKLAVDWISHNIYWTDPQYKWIMVQSLIGNNTSMYHVLIHENLEGPHALALDPIECLLFWSDIGTFTKIEVSSLSGRNRKSLISSNLINPYSMAADYDTRRLYFVDMSRRTVETVTYEGRDRNVLVKSIHSGLFDLAVYKDYLYVTSLYSSRLKFFNKTNGNVSYKSSLENYNTYTSVTVFHPDVQPTPETAHCINYGCEHICVTEKDGASCLCKEGYIINQDKRTCSLNNEYFHRGLMYSNGSNICIVDIRIVTYFIFNPNCVLKINGTRYMVLDTDQRQIFIANNTAIYASKVDNPDIDRLTTQSGNISGLAWDGYDRNLYWIEEDTGIIWRTSELSKITQIFMKDLKRPRDVLVLSHERYGIYSYQE